ANSQRDCTTSNTRRPVIRFAAHFLGPEGGRGRAQRCLTPSHMPCLFPPRIGETVIPLYPDALRAPPPVNYRSSTVDPALQDLRNKLADSAHRLVATLAERDRLVGEVGTLKLERQGNLRDLQREEALLTRLVAEARAAGLDGHYVARLFREILDHSVRKQQ